MFFERVFVVRIIDASESIIYRLKKDYISKT